ncbi:hypothetical protein R3P38DRAFT_3194123 [Favolaschia claudopus]|uniref:Uncharacterized protein n=1 Tax=Favolaschia claudopus TaxID=2862362 RepID=A0AAW0BGQ6_9AGAR
MSDLSPSVFAQSMGTSPPDYRLPTARPHTSYQMYGGLTISNQDAVRWFEEKYGMSLAKDHSQDANVRMALQDLLMQEEGWHFGVHYAPRRDSDSDCYDFLATTQSENGVWEHNSWGWVDLPEHQMKGDTAQEERMREILHKRGKSLSLKFGEFQCFYRMS